MVIIGLVSPPAPPGSVPVPIPVPPPVPEPAGPTPTPAQAPLHPKPALRSSVAERLVLSVITFGLKLQVPPPAGQVNVCGRESEVAFNASHLTPFEFSEQFPAEAAG